jgi:hypothetical protein
MPRPAVGVLGGVERGGQRAVGGQAPAQRRTLVDGGPDERMVETDRGRAGAAETDESGLLGG